jgi:hypothetical protein
MRVRIATIKTRGFLGLGETSVALNAGLTVVVGPNGSGKSSLVGCIDLVMRAVAAVDSPQEFEELTRTFDPAVEYGKTEFECRMSVDLCTDREKHLLLTFIRAAATSGLNRSNVGSAPAIDPAVRATFTRDAIVPLTMGTLVVHFDRRASQRWTVGYEMSLGDRIVHFALAGRSSGVLADGPMVTEAVTATPRTDLWTAIGLQPPESPPQSFNLPALTLSDLVPPNSSVELSVAATGQPTKEPESIEELYRLLDRVLPTTRYLGFAAVLSMILTEGLLLTDNLRSPLRTSYKLSELASPLSLSNGSCAPGELLRLKNGTSPERVRYERAQKIFNAFTGHGFDVRLSVVSQGGADQSTEVEALPAVLERQGDIPLALAGAGFHEALLLATLLSSEDQVIVLDEPAVQLAVGAQHRVLAEVRRRQESGGQIVLITHSPELVPAGSSSDLGCIVRLSRGSAGAEVHRLDPADSNNGLQRRFGQLLRTSDIRGLLFADGVLLTEGGTETGALERWLGSSADDANVRIVPVDGHTAYGTHVELLDAYGIPWAILCDGPALRCGSAMHKQLSTHGRFQGLAAANTADFEAVKAWWKRGGVHTLASEFGDDGSKSGEFEVFLKALNADVFKRADKANQRSKVRTGMLFADRVECPDQVVELWSQVIQVLRPRPTPRLADD